MDMKKTPLGGRGKEEVKAAARQQQKNDASETPKSQGLSGKKGRTSADYRDVDERPRIESALPFIDAEDRDTWLKIAMAVKGELGEEGFHIWNEWSQGASNYKERSAHEVWRSCDESGEIGLGTLFHLAKEGGWNDSTPTRELTPEQVEERRRSREEARKRDEAETARQQAQAAAWAKSVWEQSAKVLEHRYLSRKQITPTDTLRQIDAGEVQEILGYVPQASGQSLKGPLIVVPAKKANGAGLCTLEFIDSEGRKTALPGRGTKSGAFWSTERLDDPAALLIGEGVATVLSATRAAGLPGLAALSSSNLQAVATSAREQFPAAKIIILSDLKKDSGEPDQNAVKAAQAAGGCVAVPDFGPDRKPEEKDFNDLHVKLGPDAVRTCINAAGQHTTQATSGAKPVLIRASDVKPEPILWLWDGYLAAGKLHIFAGPPGTGKTTIAMTAAGTVSRGGRWPDGSLSRRGSVLVWSGEDGIADTLVPRLIAAGANLDKVFFISGMKEETQEKRPFDPATDLTSMDSMVKEIGDVRLIVIDPIVSAITGDSHKNAEVRRALQPICDLAERTGAAVLGITHFTKNTQGRDVVERITGSIAFGAVARIALIAAKNDDCRVFMRAKSNIGPDGDGFKYEFEQVAVSDDTYASKVTWAGAVHGSAQEVLAAFESEENAGPAVQEASQFLLEILKDEGLQASEVKKAAEEAGISFSAIRRAKTRLGITARKGQGQGAPWFWTLPEDAQDAQDAQGAQGAQKNKDAQDAQTKKPEHLEHLTFPDEIEVDL